MTSLFSRDGRNLLVSSGNSIQLYSVETGALLATLGGHTAPICGLVHHPLKGRSALSGSTDGTLREWDVETGACLKVVNVGAPIVKVCAAIVPRGCAPNIYVVVSLGAFSSSTKTKTMNSSLETKVSADVQMQQQPTSPAEEAGRNNNGRTSRRRPAPSSVDLLPLTTTTTTTSSTGGSIRKLARSSSSLSSALKESATTQNAALEEEELATPMGTTTGLFEADDVLVMNLHAQFREALTYPLGNEVACVQSSPPTFALASALTPQGGKRVDPWSFLLEVNLEVLRVSRVLLSVRGFSTGLSAKCFGAVSSAMSSTTFSPSSSSGSSTSSNVNSSSTSNTADVAVIFAVKRSVYIVRGNFITRYSSKSFISSISPHPFDNLLSVGEAKGPISTWILPELANDFKQQTPFHHTGGLLKSSSSSSSSPSQPLALPMNVIGSPMSSSSSSSSSSAILPFAASGSALSFPSLHSSPTLLSGGTSFRFSDVHWHAHAPWVVSFSSDGSYLVSGGEEGTLVLWQLQAVGAGSAAGPVKDKKTMTFVPRLGAPLRTISTYSAGALQPFEVGAMDVVIDDDQQTASAASTSSLTTPGSPQPANENIVESTAVVASPIATQASSSLHVRNAPPVMYAVSLVDNSVVVINGLSLRTMWRASGLAIAGMPASVPRGVALFSAVAFAKLNTKALADAKEAKDAQAELRAKAPSSTFFSTQLPSSIYHSFTRHLIHGVVPDPRTRGVFINGFPGRGSLQLLDVARGVAHLQIDVAQRNVVSRSNDEPPPPVRVTHAALSPDGLHLATLEVSSAIEPGAGEGNTLKFWSWVKDSTSGEFVLVTRVDSPHKAEVTVLEFHPFEALVVSGSRDRTFKQWQREAVLVSSATAAGKALHAINGQDNVQGGGGGEGGMLQSKSAKELSGMNRKERRQSRLAGAPMPSTLMSHKQQQQQVGGDKPIGSSSASSSSSSATSSLLPPPPPQAPRYTWTCLSAGFYRDFPVTAGAFSIDGSVLALAFGHTITLWSPRSNALKRALTHVVDSSSSSTSSSSSSSSSTNESRETSLSYEGEGVDGLSSNDRNENDDDVFGDGDASILMGNPNGRVINDTKKGRMLVSATRYPNITRVAFLGTSSLLVSATKKSIVLWDLLLCTQVYAFDAAVVSLTADRLGSSSSHRYAVVIEDKSSNKSSRSKSSQYDCVLFEGASPVPISAWHLPSSSSHAGATETEGGGGEEEGAETESSTSNKNGELSGGNEDTKKGTMSSSLSSFLSAIPEPPLYAVSFLSPAALSSAATAIPFLTSTIDHHLQPSVTPTTQTSNAKTSSTSSSSATLLAGSLASTLTPATTASSAPSTPANGILVLGPLNEVYTLLAPPHALARLNGPVAANATTAATTVLVSSSQNLASFQTDDGKKITMHSSSSSSSSSDAAMVLPKNATSNGMLGLSSSSSLSSQPKRSPPLFEGNSLETARIGASSGTSGVATTQSQSLQSALSRFGTVAAVHSPSFLFEGLIDSLLQPSQQQHNQLAEQEKVKQVDEKERVKSFSPNSSAISVGISSPLSPTPGSKSDVHDGLVSLFSSILEENSNNRVEGGGGGGGEGEEKRKETLRTLALSSLVLAASAQSGPDLILNACSATNKFQKWSWNGTQFFLPGSPNMCIDIEGFNTNPGAEVYTWPCGDGSKDNEVWIVTGNQIKSAQTPATCLAATSTVYSNGVTVSTDNCNTNDPLQGFSFDSTTGLITHVASGLCVDGGSPIPFTEYCDDAVHKTWPFCDYTLSLDVRSADIVSRLSVADKIKALNTATPTLTSVGMHSYQWWSEATHGLSGPGVSHNSNLPGASNTALPITTSCSFNRSMWTATGNVIGREGRVYQNQHLSGATFWTPVINIVREPRWGRNIESAGEDPFLSGQYAINFIQGFEHAKETPYPLQSSTCCKHFIANELDNSNGTDRNHIDVFVPQQDLVDSYMPSFQMCVEEGKASGIMCSYNAVNGVPSCANDWLLGTVLRGEWQFDGYVTSDCDADSDVYYSHHYTKTTSEAVKLILAAGTDVDCGDFMTNNAAQALADGNITEADMDTVLKRLFRVRLRLGQFDPPGPLQQIGIDQVCNDYTAEVARDGVRQSVVLAKNTGNVLPLDATKFSKVAVIGPLIDQSDTTQYYGSNPCPNTNWNPLDAITQHISTAQGLHGVPSVGSNDQSGIPAAATLAGASDLVILQIGSDLSLEAEGRDRTSIDFSDAQKALVTAVTAAATGPVIAMVFSGGAMDISSLLSNPKVVAIIICGQPSVQVVGAGDVIFGKTLDGRNVAPAGRMSQMTYPAEFVNQVSMFEFSLRPGPSNWPPGTTPGRTYRFYTGTPVLPFGFGLSYTTWVYTPLPDPTPPVNGMRLVDLTNVKKAANDHELKGANGVGTIPKSLQSYAANFWLNVTNTGSVDSDDVVLGFMVPPGAGTAGVPLQELFGFERVFVPAGQTVTVYIGAQGVRFTQAGVDGVRRVLPGEYTVRFGVKETFESGMGFTEVKVLAQ